MTTAAPRRCPAVTGTFTALATSLAILTAACGSEQSVDADPNSTQVAAVAITPASFELTDVGDTTRLLATATSTEDALLSAATFTWRTTDSTVAVVDQEGLVTATGHGGVVIVAQSGGVDGSAKATVTFERRVVFVDEAHFNYHTVTGRYAPFAELLRFHGYDVRPSTAVFDSAALAPADILVISNALGERNAGGDWSIPTPSAFGSEEIDAVHDWVSQGGALLLIADHMPFPGAADSLAAAFGVQFGNNFAFDTLQLAEPSTCLTDDQVHVFRRADGTLSEHPIVEGERADRRIDSVATFTGQAFRAGVDADSVLVFGPTSVAIYPAVAWQFPDTLTQVPVEAWLQGATIEFGHGRIAVFGEAAMFSQQTCGSDVPMGFNSTVGSQNSRFILNVLHWLSGLLDEP